MNAPAPSPAASAAPAMAAAVAPPLRVLLVDDEPLARLRLRTLLAAPENPPNEVVGEAARGEDLLAWLASQSCDLVLLDIQLPGRDGLKLAEALAHLPRPPAVVFVTAHAEHALRAFDLAAVDYLTKPVRRDRLAVALARVAQRRTALAAAAAPVLPVAPDGLPPGPAGAEPASGVSPQNPLPAALVVSSRGHVLRLPVAEVLYLKAEQKYVTLVSQQGRWLLDDPLSELEQRLGPGFLRVHRNAVVALSAARALSRRPAGESAEGEADEGGWQLLLANGEQLAVSRRQVAEVRQALAAPTAVTIPGAPPSAITAPGHAPAQPNPAPPDDAAQS